MNKIIKNSVIFIRIFIVLIIVLSMGIHGAFAAERMFKNCDEIDKVEEIQTETPQLKAGLPSPDELPENMETSSKPDSEQPAYNAVRLMVKVDNSNSKNRLRQQEAYRIFKEFVSKNSHISIVSSTSLVNSELGRTFTLVGSKPSGTS